MGNTQAPGGEYQETGASEGQLSFVAVWALFGIEFISRDAEYVVALDADAVDIRFGSGWSLRLNSLLIGRRRSDRRVGHGGILSRGSVRAASPSGLKGIPKKRA